MKSRVIIVAISLAIFMTPVATAAEFNVDQNSLSEYKEMANNHSDQLPEFVKDLVGDQDINIYIDRNQSESHNLSVKMNGTEIEAINNQSIGQADLEVWTSTDIIQNISESDQPVERMRTAIDEDEIEYQANDTWTKVKLFFAETFMDLF